MKKKCFLVAVLVLSVFAMMGCVVGQFHRIGPQSHFAYPNSNIKALGPVSLKMKGKTSAFAMPTVQSSEIDTKVFNAALSQVEGSNVIIDYMRTTTVYKFGDIHWTEEYLEGTAAHMDVGQQELN